MLIITVRKIALPCLNTSHFSSTPDSACVGKTFMLQHGKVPMFTHKTNTLREKPDRADNPLSKVYKIYGIIIIIVIKEKMLLASSVPYVAPGRGFLQIQHGGFFSLL